MIVAISTGPGFTGCRLPISCQHHTHLFLPWHRAYLYFFEKTLQDRVPGVTLPWWDWTRYHDDGIPPAYAAQQVTGAANPLHDAPIQPGGRRIANEDRTWRRPPGGGGFLP